MKWSLVVTLIILSLAPISAHAQLNFQFTQAAQSGSSGQTLTFSGTLLNAGPSEVFLNGYSTTPIAPDLTLDDTKFFNNVPFSLMPGDSWSGELFDIHIAPTAVVADSMIGFTIIGGADGSAQDDLTTQSFSVNVPAPAVPETNTATLLGSGLVGIALYALRRRSRRA